MAGDTLASPALKFWTQAHQPRSRKNVCMVGQSSQLEMLGIVSISQLT